MIFFFEKSIFHPINKTVTAQQRRQSFPFKYPNYFFRVFLRNELPVSPSLLPFIHGEHREHKIFG